MVSATCGGDVGSQSAPVVRGAWPSKAGVPIWGRRRLNVIRAGYPVEGLLSGADFGSCRPVADIASGEPTA